MANKTSHLERTAEEPRSTVRTQPSRSSYLCPRLTSHPAFISFLHGVLLLRLIDSVEYGYQGLHAVTLRKIGQVNEKVRLFRLELSEGSVKFLPGQWLDTYVPGIAKAGGFTVTCAPSAAATSSSFRVPYLELAVQKCPENEVAAWLWQPAEKVIGSLLHVRVGGSFVFPPTLNVRLENIKRVIFVAGGLGINPFMSMLSYIGEMNGFPRLEILVFYASKIPDSGGLENILFVQRIASLFANGRLEGKFRLYLTGNSETCRQFNTSCGAAHLKDLNVEIQKGRLSVLELGRRLENLDHGSSIVYVCGPPTMTDYIFKFLSSESSGLNIPPKHVMTERWW